MKKAGNHSGELKVIAKEKMENLELKTTISENKFSLAKLSSQIEMTKEKDAVNLKTGQQKSSDV